MKDALTRGAQQGREKLDELRADKRRQETLAELGELVLDLIRRGEIDVAELPEARELIRQLDDIDANAEESDITTTQPFNRNRFDDRGAAPAPTRRSRDDDGTVGSGARWSPSKPAAPAPSAAAAAAEPPRRGPQLPTLPKDPHRKGGISFEDEDLADYMHPDDVPPKDPSDRDS